MFKKALARQGIFPIGGSEPFANTNLVYLVDFGGERALCKVYQNKYFPEQQIYEKNVLSILGSFGLAVPAVKSEGLVEGRRYSILSQLAGDNLVKYTPRFYQKRASVFLKELHGLDTAFSLPYHPLQSDFDIIMRKALGSLSSDVVEKYSQLKFNTYKRAFCHSHPNFKHFIFNQEQFSGVVDFEDARILPIEVDYVSFIKDQIITSKPLEEILNFVESYAGDLNNLIPYLIQLYLLDNHYGHGLRNKYNLANLDILKILFSDLKFEPKIKEALVVHN